MQKLFQRTTNVTYQRLWGRMATFWPSVFVQSIQVCVISELFNKIHCCFWWKSLRMCEVFMLILQEGIERARREKYAFILDSPAAEYIANRRPCDLYTIEPFLDIQQFSLALRKNDNLKVQLPKPKFMPAETCWLWNCCEFSDVFVSLVSFAMQTNNFWPFVSGENQQRVEKNGFKSRHDVNLFAMVAWGMPS